MTGEVQGWGGYEDERSRLRISDADRHQVAELLRQSAGEGRLDIEELEQRLEATYAAKTYGELVPITVDLPVRGVSPTPIVPVPSSTIANRYGTSIAIMNSTNRTGVWEVGSTHSAFALMGAIKLDLRDARFTARETVIHAYGCWAGIDIYVNAQTRVIVDGVGIMGTFDQARDKVDAVLGPDSPLVRVNGLALMAGITVQRRSMPGERRRRLGR